MVVPAEVVDVLLSLKQHFRLLQQICGTCSCGSQTGCAGFRPRPKILSCVGPGPNQWISRAHQRSSWPTPTAFAHIITHPGQLVRYPKALQSAPRVPNSIKLLQYMYAQTNKTKKTFRPHNICTVSTYIEEGYWLTCWRESSNIFKCSNRDSRESLNSHPQ